MFQIFDEIFYPLFTTSYPLFSGRQHFAPHTQFPFFFPSQYLTLYQFTWFSFRGRGGECMSPPLRLSSLVKRIVLPVIRILCHLPLLFTSFSCCFFLFPDVPHHFFLSPTFPPPPKVMDLNRIREGFTSCCLFPCSRNPTHLLFMTSLIFRVAHGLVFYSSSHHKVYEWAKENNIFFPEEEIYNAEKYRKAFKERRGKRRRRTGKMRRVAE